MSKRNSLKVALVLLALTSAGWLGRVAASPQDLPAGKGVEIARNRCLNCHEADLIVAQKLSRAGWVRSFILPPPSRVVASLFESSTGLWSALSDTAIASCASIPST